MSRKPTDSMRAESFLSRFHENLSHLFCFFNCPKIVTVLPQMLNLVRELCVRDLQTDRRTVEYKELVDAQDELEQAIINYQRAVLAAQKRSRKTQGE